MITSAVVEDRLLCRHVGSNFIATATIVDKTVVRKEMQYVPTKIQTSSYDMDHYYVHYYVTKTESLSTCQTKRLSTTALVITNNASFSYRMWLSYRMRLDKSQTMDPLFHDGHSTHWEIPCPCCIYHLVPGRRMWIHAPGRKTDSVNTLLVPGRRAWTIKLPGFKNPISIVNKIAGYDIWRQILAWYEI